MDHTSRKCVAGGIAARGESIDVRSSRIGQPEELANFVECFARSVVPGLPEQTVLAKACHVDEQRVAAANHQSNGRPDAASRSKKWRKEMAFEMIDGEKRLLKRHGQTF